MDKEFVPYDVAIQLRDLGMAEPTLAVWGEGGVHFPVLYLNQHVSLGGGSVPAPTYRQAFRFMRVNFGFYPSVRANTKIAGWDAHIMTLRESDWFNNVYREYHEAELGCLRGMIYLAKPIRKVNGGDGADLCPTCRKIISEPNTCDCRAIIQQPVQ